MTGASVNLIIRANARQLASEMRRSSAELRGFGRDAQAEGRRAHQGLSEAGRGADYARRQIEAARLAVIGFFTVQAAARGLSDLRARADGYANLTAKIRLATEGQVEFRDAEAEVFAIAQRTSSRLDSTATLYSRINQALKDQGVAQQEVLGLTETINQAFAVSGATTQEAAAATIQLSQAFASGVLRGEEFNSVNEQAPRLMQALADSLGVARGELRRMAEEGELTSDKLRQAFAGEQAERIAQEFEQLPLTIERSFTQLDNALTRYIGQADQANGVSAAVAASIQGLAQNVDVLASAVGLLVVVLGGRLTASMVAAVAAKLQASAAAARLAQADALAAAEARALTAAQVAKARAVATASAAVIAAAQAASAQAVAEGRATSLTRAATAAAAAKAVAVRAVTGALSLMGGPLGLAITALALLAARFVAAGQAARQLRQNIDAARDASDRFRETQDLNDALIAGKALQAAREELRLRLSEQRELRRQFSLSGYYLDQGRLKSVEQFDVEIAENERKFEDLNRRLAENARLIEEVSAAQATGSRTTRQIARDSAEFTRELEKQREASRLATIEATQGLRARLIEEAIKADGVRSERELSTARLALIDATVRQKQQEEAASQAKKDAAQAQREAAKADRERAEELKRLAEAQRQYREETALLEATNRGDLFGQAEQTRQRVAAARRDGAAAGLSDAEIQKRVAAILADARRAVDTMIAEGRIALLQGTGQIAEAAAAEAARKYQGTIAFLLAEGDAGNAAIFQRLFDVEVAKGQLAQLEQQVQDTFDRIQREQQSVQTQLQAGTLTEHEARQRIVELYREQGAILQTLLPQMEALARATGDPTALANVQQIRGELERMQATTNLLQEQIGQTFQYSFANALESLATGTASLRDAVTGFLRDMAAGLARMAAAALAQKAWAGIISLFNKGKDASVGEGAKELALAGTITAGAGLAISSGATTLMGAAAALQAAATTLMIANSMSSVAGFAEGGYTGPGGKYQVAGVVHAGEYVIKAAQVRRYGIALFDALNQGRYPLPAIRQVHVPRAGYAEGGLAMAPGQQPQNRMRVYLLMDQDELAQRLARHPAMEKAVVAIAGANGTAIRAEW